MVTIVLICTIPHVYALKDCNPFCYIDDLSDLPGPEIYQQKPTQHYSVKVMIEWINTHQMICAAGLTMTSFALMYATDSTFRNKVHAWLGLHIEQQEQSEV